MMMMMMIRGETAVKYIHRDTKITQPSSISFCLPIHCCVLFAPLGVGGMGGGGVRMIRSDSSFFLSNDILTHTRVPVLPDLSIIYIVGREKKQTHDQRAPMFPALPAFPSITTMSLSLPYYSFFRDEFVFHIQLFLSHTKLGSWGERGGRIFCR